MEEECENAGSLVVSGGWLGVGVNSLESKDQGAMRGMEVILWCVRRNKKEPEGEKRTHGGRKRVRRVCKCGKCGK